MVHSSLVAMVVECRLLCLRVFVSGRGCRSTCPFVPDVSCGRVFYPKSRAQDPSRSMWHQSYVSVQGPPGVLEPRLWFRWSV